MNYIKERILERFNIKKSIIPAICLFSILSAGFAVAEKAAPVITLADGPAVTIDYNKTFDYNNYMTFENTETINVIGEVDSSKEGEYNVTVEAINQYNQKAKQELIVTVDDISAPVITLKKDKVTLKYGQSFNAKSYIKSVTDNKEDNLKSSVKISGKVNSKKAGDYTVTYTVKDKSGNTAKKTLKVTVKKATAREKIVAAAKSKLGCKYKWGSTGPKTFDCSGLVKYCYNQAGRYVPRSSGLQKGYGKVISISEAKPGDIVWRPGHVGLYVGNGQVIHAPSTGKTVSYTNASSFRCAIRVL